ncbi:hypothetical protein PMAYCL1PPCAC_05206, partial [Pristionchus mayeri]
AFLFISQWFLTVDGNFVIKLRGEVRASARLDIFAMTVGDFAQVLKLLNICRSYIWHPVASKLAEFLDLVECPHKVFELQFANLEGV